jgi:uncharacterized glyoxalase superfamily protein PhnB
MTVSVRKLTPVLIVDDVERCLSFWTERLGFAAPVQVPHEDHVGFAIVAAEGVELMYQSRASIAADVPAALDPARGHSATLFVEVADLDAVERAMAGLEIVLPRRRTFYGMDEFGVREPGGHVVIFAQPAEGTEQGE